MQVLKQSSSLQSSKEIVMLPKKLDAPDCGDDFDSLRTQALEQPSSLQIIIRKDISEVMPALGQPSMLQLLFTKKLSQPIITDCKVLDVDGNPIKTILADKNGNQMVPTSLPHPIKLEIVVLDGDFPFGDNETWTSEQFNNHIVRERVGKPPLLTGDLNATMRDGIAPIGDIKFTGNSLWLRSGKFRVAVRVAPESTYGVRIREGMTEAFVVKNHHGRVSSNWRQITLFGPPTPRMHDCGMEEDDIQAQACKFPRVGKGRNDSNKIGSKGNNEQYPDEKDDGELRRKDGVIGSRIIRCSRASVGKDRHSKVMTSKGLRDRRVRLSVATAIQFYDLQDRLGYDQPSKAVEWLIKRAADAIAELPSLSNTFPDSPKHPSDEKRASVSTAQVFDSAELDLLSNYQQNQARSKSARSSTLETSKVMTSKGLRDRRVRLSVATAIQFYDLQDRLGYDQPSKAVEWLIKRAADAIAELPSRSNTFLDGPKHPSDEKRASVSTEQVFDSAELDLLSNYQQNQARSKSARSSTSETSKGSGLTYSRS
ncbi:hypothetical protein L6164_032448 [Bauhinia variegata]|uniref:Uncharacterized protein n=1 Tax=Bauhinia variegata TaxID=167791 RepID=A0ACB9KNV6_BAUVA|nr:hypothetical protein L6164_032448 [Bauhinia variegata]